MKTSTVVWIIIVILIIIGAVWYFHGSNPSAVSSIPAVTMVSPNTGTTMGGDTVEITGSGFTGVTAVDFGSVPAASFNFNSDTSITATSPAGTSGSVDVTVITPSGTSAVGPSDQFAYAEPATTTTATTTSNQ